MFLATPTVTDYNYFALLPIAKMKIKELLDMTKYLKDPEHRKFSENIPSQ